MISFESAYTQVMQNTRDFGHERVDLLKALGRVSRSDWYADRDMPPYDRVTMDGIAINFDECQELIKLPISGIVAAGDAKTTLQSHTAVEIMTGAVLPNHADTVIRYEDLKVQDKTAELLTDFKKGQNIHKKGEDRKKGDLLLSKGSVIGSPEIGVAASIGLHQIDVARYPRIIIISTGDELVEINENPEPHQIRKSNVYRILTTLEKFGFDVQQAHLEDNLSRIKQKLSEFIYSFDVIVLSGGVSKGKFDFVPEALDQLGVEKHFHGVAQRPGKPFWFGTHKKNCTIFALPGNPVSSFMCTHLYVLNWLQKSLGIKLNTHHAILQEDVEFAKPLEYFLEAEISYDECGSIKAMPKKGHGSGDLANLMHGSAFIQLAASKSIFKKGTAVPVHFYR